MLKSFHYSCNKIPKYQKQKIYTVLRIYKVAYFSMTRSILVEQAHKTHREATANYREAKEFAKWSANDRHERRKELPSLTPEQEKQMKAYLRMMREHHALNPDSEKQ